MKQRRSKIDYTEEINSICRSLNNQKSQIKLYLNPINTIFAKFNSEVNIPHISIKGITEEQSLYIVKWLSNMIPQYITGHKFTTTGFPNTDLYSIQFTQLIIGKYINFIHILSIDMKFSGDSNNIIEKGNLTTLPSYKTDRAYFQSYLLPIEKDKNTDSFKIKRISNSKTILSDEKRHTYAIFDEYSSRDRSIEICNSLDKLNFSIPPKIFPIIEEKFMTLIFNVINPTQQELQKASSIFEPIFLYQYYNRKASTQPIPHEIMERLGTDLTKKNEKIHFTKNFISNANHWFASYKLSHNDELRLKGWKAIEIS